MKTEKRWISSQDLFSAIARQLAENRRASFTVTGMSMWPFLCHGRDRVVLEAADPARLRVGDIVLLRTVRSSYLLHRVTRRSEEGIETTGDGNCFRDGFFPYSCVVGRCVRLVRPDRTIDCDAPHWRLAFRCWMLLFPVRRPLMAVWMKIRNVIRK